MTTSLKQLSRYRFAGRNEQAVREEWIAPLLVHLGYGPSTIHEVRYEVPLRLAKPFRRIGRKRVSVDYVPTVVGRGLWIIEAKAAGADDWEEAISQAWLYATHPEVDAPFMVVADGSRIAVYDTHPADWDVAIVDVNVRDLETRFGELSDVLGAANVARAVRTRRLRHIGSAMRAELDARRLEEYVREVKELATAAWPAVQENQSAVWRDQAALSEARERELLDELGLFVVGVWANQPFGVQKRMMGVAKEVLLRQAPEARHDAFDQLLLGARLGSPPVVRESWNLRLVRLFLALTCAEADGCDFLHGAARSAIRDHLLGFPDDPLAQAARRLERVLPAAASRILLATEELDLRGEARKLQAHWSDEQRIRHGIDADYLLIQAVDKMTRDAWTSVRWETAALNDTASQLENVLAKVEVPSTSAVGPAHDPYFMFAYERDMLEMATLYEVGSLIRPEHLDADTVDRLREIAATDTDTSRMADPARRLVESYDAATTP